MRLTRNSVSASQPTIHDLTSPSRSKKGPSSKIASQKKTDGRQSFSGQTIVNININEGDRSTTFSIHKDFLTTESTFFRAALKGNWIEAQTNAINFQDVSATVFEIFVNWVYSKRVTDASGNIPIKIYLTQLWIFADRMGMPKLQNAAIKAMNGSTGSVSFFYVYENTPERSPLRLYLAASSASAHLKQGNELQFAEYYPKAMLIDILSWIGANYKKKDKIGRMSQADIEKYFIEEGESSSVLRDVGGMATPSRSQSPNGSGNSFSTLGASVSHDDDEEY